MPTCNISILFCVSEMRSGGRDTPPPSPGLQEDPEEENGMYDDDVAEEIGNWSHLARHPLTDLLLPILTRFQFLVWRNDWLGRYVRGGDGG